MTWRLVIAAALAGSAIGAVAVLADEPSPPAPVPAVAPARTSPRAARPPVSARKVTIETRMDDPKGGPPWAVRRFTSDPRVGECVELGRIVNREFGWIDGDGAFRRAQPGRHDTPDLCLPAAWLKRTGAQPIATTTVAYATGHTPQPSRGIVWGLAAPGIRAIEPAGGRPLATSPRGAFLAVSTTPARLSPQGELVRRDGTTRRYDHRPEYPPGTIEPRPGTTRVAVEAPDPAGGQPWAILAAEGPHGELCRSQEGRLLGLRLGEIDAYDTFEPRFDQIVCPREDRSAYPLRLTAGVWSPRESDDTRGRVERRVLTGRTTISGQADPSVASVTLRTPSDVRTLVPSTPDHLILAVYQGTFPTGKVTATAHLKDGRDVTRSVYAG